MLPCEESLRPACWDGQTDRQLMCVMCSVVLPARRPSVPTFTLHAVHPPPVTFLPVAGRISWLVRVCWGIHTEVGPSQRASACPYPPPSSLDRFAPPCVLFFSFACPPVQHSTIPFVARQHGSSLA